jgi:protein-S-isoprenylcysteine O-methyltransferase Ste14
MSDMFSVVIIVLVVGLWGAMHSILASLSLKHRMEKKFGILYHRYYRLAYVLFSASSFLGVLAAVIFLPDKHFYTIPLPWIIITGIIQMAGALLVVYSLHQTGTMIFLGFSQAVKPGFENKTVPFITNGVFRYIRHPIYTGSLLLIWFIPFMSRNILTFNIAATVYILIGVIFEERKLEIEFGEQYREYKRHTPKFIPFLKR